MRGKVVLVTGAGAGIGAETSRLFASLGARLSLVDKGSVQDTLVKCLEEGLSEEDVIPLHADLTIFQNLADVIDQTVTRFGQLDVLVNNAGVGCPSLLKDMNEDLYDQIMNINCRAVLFLMQKAVPHLIKTKGNVVNVSSVFGLRPGQNILYSTSKAAVNQMTQCAALDLASHRIRVNAVNPGHIRTEIYKALGMSDEECETKYEELKLKYPLGRVGTASEIAKAIAFLADNSQSAFITGICMPIDGGFHLVK